MRPRTFPVGQENPETILSGFGDALGRSIPPIGSRGLAVTVKVECFSLGAALAEC
jgi:hypothetical protein